MLSLSRRGTHRLASANPLAQKLQTIKENRKKQEAEENSTSVELDIPDNWVEFAQLSKIRSAGKIVSFDPYEYQKKLVDIMLGQSVVVVKARQLGISETICSFMLWRACREAGYLAVIFSKTQNDTSLLARRMKRMISSLGLQTVTENLGDIEIKGRGRILFKNSKPDSARGIESVCDVLFDEYAFIDEAKAIFDAICPAQQMLGDAARSFIVSTPNGRSGHYWDLLTSGNEGKSLEAICENISKGEEEPFQYWIDSGGWAKVVIHWKAHPVYGSNPHFLEEIHQKKKLSWETIKQEYDLSFQESDANYFDFEIINKCLDGKKETPQERTIYFIGVDPNFGGDDYCVASVLKYCEEKGFVLVDWYRKRKTTSEYNLFQIGDLIKKFINPIVTVETNSGGKIYYEQLSKNYAGAAYLIGARTSEDSKAVFLERLKLVMEKGLFHCPRDCPLTEELLLFRRKGKKLEAAQGGTDDFVVATGLALIGAVEKGFL